MSDFVFGWIIGLCCGFALTVGLCYIIGAPRGTTPVGGFKKPLPMNCVIDYHRDGIHYCILEGK